MPHRNPNKDVKVYVLTLAIACLAWVTVTPVYAETVTISELEWITMSISLLGGLALFLYGMEQMAEALKTVAGQRMKDILSRLTTNRISAAATGAFVTAIIQSSSVTTVLVVGFISAGMMSLSQSIGIIMGANIGTTITAQIVAFKITKTAMLLITIGFSMLFFGKSDKLKSYGGMTMGLGLIFFGMSIMSDAMGPLRDYQPFVDVMIQMENPFIAILVAALFTALVQSSSATTGIVVVMASQGFITLPVGIALALGANIGTCVTALLAAIGKPREALRASVIHVLFNIAGVALWIGFIAQLAELAIWMSPAYTDLAGLDKLAKETPRQIANANTAFNVMNTLIFLPFTTLISQLTVKLIPDKPVIEKEIVRTQFLDKELLNTPALALDRVRKEIGHMGDIVTAMLCGIQPAIEQRRREHIEDIEKRDDQVDVLHERILSYLGSVQKTTLSEEESNEITRLLSAANKVEAAGDIIETDLGPLGYKVINENIKTSMTSQEVFSGLYSAVIKAFEMSISAVVEKNEREAQDVMNMQGDIQHLTDRALAEQSRELASTEHVNLHYLRIEIELIDKLRQIYSLTKRIARTVLPK